MGEERYVDPNSGAAPQPGGFAVAPTGDPVEAAEAKELDTDNSRLPGGEVTDDGSDDAGDAGEYAELLDGNVDEVNAYLEEHPDERDAVLAAEREGKGRKGILGDE